MANDFQSRDARALIQNAKALYKALTAAQGEKTNYSTELEKQLQYMLHCDIFTGYADSEIAGTPIEGNIKRAFEELLVCCCKVLNESVYVTQIEKLLNEYKWNISPKIDKLNSNLGLLRVFASAQKKQDAADAYAYLSGVVNGNYGMEAQDALQRRQYTAFVQTYEAVQDFEANRGKYYKFILSWYKSEEAENARITAFADLYEQYERLTGYSKQFDEQIKGCYQPWAMSLQTAMQTNAFQTSADEDLIHGVFRMPLSICDILRYTYAALELARKKQEYTDTLSRLDNGTTSQMKRLRSASAVQWVFSDETQKRDWLTVYERCKSAINDPETGLVSALSSITDNTISQKLWNDTVWLAHFKANTRDYMERIREWMPVDAFQKLVIPSITALETQYNEFSHCSEKYDETARTCLQMAVNAQHNAITCSSFVRIANEEVDGAVDRYDTNVLAMLHALYTAFSLQSEKKVFTASFDAFQQEMSGAIRTLFENNSAFLWLFLTDEQKETLRRLYQSCKEKLLGDNGVAERMKLLNSGAGRTTAEATFEELADFRRDPNLYKGNLPLPTLVIAHIPACEELIRRYEELKRRMRDTSEETDGFRRQVEEAASDTVNEEVLKALRKMPVQKLAEFQSGIKIKPLTDDLYSTVADVYLASIFMLSAVKGVSETAAYRLKAAANEYADIARKKARIRLSLDNKTPSYSKLVRAVCVYKSARERESMFSAWTEECRSSIDALANALAGAPAPYDWFFLREEEKQRYREIYTRLKAWLDGHVYPSDPALTLDVSESYAWDDFSRQPIVYTNILEEIVPEYCGSAEPETGLSPELIRAIQDQAFFPNGLRCELRRYQEWGVKYILHQEKVLLGDEMGLGKTVQAIATMVSLKNTGAHNFMVVCPASVLENWYKEVSSKSLLRVIRMHGKDRDEAFQDWLQYGGAVITTYETLARITLPEEFRYSMLIVDEAHYIKNPSARRSINVKKFAERTDRILFMTGTALENRVDEMIELVRLLQPETARNLSYYASRTMIGKYRSEAANVYYRRKREDVLTELPDMEESKEWCSLSAEEEAVYEEAVLAKKYADTRRVSWNVPDPARSTKAKRMMEIIEEAAQDDRKILVFSFFLDTIRAVCELAGERCMQPINGSVTPARRQEIIDEFERAPAGTVLAAQIQSGGTGLNIQAASVIILCEPQLKPSIENQAISRAYRMGQTRKVLVYRLLCVDTIEEKIVEMLEEKQREFDNYADKSAAADATEREEADIDDKTFGKLIEEEIERINEKRKTA